MRALASAKCAIAALADACLGDSRSREILVTSARSLLAPLISNQVGEAIGRFRTAWAWEGTVLRAHGHVPRKGRPLRDAKTNSLTREARKLFADINVHGHDLRHEYACRLAERGVPITKIQYLLGHASVVTTERYIHHTLAEPSKAAAVLERGGVFDALSDPKVGPPVAAKSSGFAVEDHAQPRGRCGLC